MQEVEIAGLAHGGSGVCRVEGQVCFVPYALPGERIRISVSRQTKGVLHAIVEDVLEPSPHRTETQCSVFGRCGGCTWLHFAYPAQADWKKRIVKDCFERIGKLEVDIGWLENPELRLGYRTRATFRGEDGRWGFYESGSHSLVDIESCPLCHPTLNDALASLRTLKLDRPVEIVVNPEGADVLAWSRSDSVELRQTFKASQSPADRAERARFVFDGIPLVNGTFSQSSLLLNRLLVKTVHRMAAGAVNVLDLYCGNGNLSLGLPEEVRIHGIDQNSSAIHGAKTLGRGTFSTGGESAFIRRIRKGGIDTIILDPPRAGAKRIVPSLRACKAERIVYVSCDPATLARDAAALVREKSWKLEEVTVIDMFPHTSHVEAVALFQRG